MFTCLKKRLPLFGQSICSSFLQTVLSLPLITTDAMFGKGQGRAFVIFKSKQLSPQCQSDYVKLKPRAFVDALITISAAFLNRVKKFFVQV